MHYLFALCLLVVSLSPALSYAKNYAVIGEMEASEAMLVCERKADAVTFVQTLHDHGREAAEAYFRKAKGCGFGKGVFEVGEVQYLASAPGLGLAKVVEITTQDGKKYWITNIAIVHKGEKGA